MDTPKLIQGRMVGRADLDLIHSLLAENSDWGRTRLSEELCEIWDWRTASGRAKDMACRSLLRSLDAAGAVALPPPRRPANNEIRNSKRKSVSHSTVGIAEALRDLLPLQVVRIETGSAELDLFGTLLDKYHYLGHRSCVGENQKYLIKDHLGRPLSCLLFGSAAWATKARDEFIGWSPEQRRARLQWVTNNTRFLILPWVQVKNLASHVLSLVSRRIRRDWIDKYGHPVSLLETFVDQSRFTGTCYQAANWKYLGRSTGRTRNSRSRSKQVPLKDIYVRSLVRNPQRELCAGDETGVARRQER